MRKNVLTTPQFASRESVIRTLFGEGTKIEKTSPISGGDSNEAFRLTLTGGKHIFMKSNTRGNFSFFTAEAAGLSAIARTETIGKPRILGAGTDEGRGGYSFLLLEFISAKTRSRNYWEDFAGQLAAMHRASTEGWFQTKNMGLTAITILAGAGRSIQRMTVGLVFSGSADLSHSFGMPTAILSGRTGEGLAGFLIIWMKFLWNLSIRHYCTVICGLEM